MAGQDQKKISFDKKMVEAQKAAKKPDWKSFKAIFVDDNGRLLQPFDLFGSTAIHVVARAGKAKLLRQLLGMLSETEQKLALEKENGQGNTLLHEAVLLREGSKTVDVIMEFGRKHQIERLLECKNKFKETPIFRAAKFGNLDMLKHIHTNHPPLESQKHFPPGESGGKLLPILHSCVSGLNFDVAIWLVKNVDKNLTQQKIRDKNDENSKESFTCFQLLSKMPMAFKSKDALEMGITRKLIYSLLPKEGYELELDDDGNNAFFKSTRDIESGQLESETGNPPKSKNAVFSSINYAVWKHLAKEFGIEKIWKQKGRHIFAEHLAKLLAESDDSWLDSHNSDEQPPLVVLPEFPSNVTEKRKDIQLKADIQKTEKIKQKIKQDREKRIQKRRQDLEEPQKQMKQDQEELEQQLMQGQEEQQQQIKQDQQEQQQLMKQGQEEQQLQMKQDQEEQTIVTSRQTPLFLAAASGIKEVVKTIVDQHPEAISHVNGDGLNVLHIAVKHRQLKIYEFIARNSAFESLKARITKVDRRTVLHQAASMEYYREQELPGVAYQLKDELDWYHRVCSIIPEHYLMHCDKEGLTAGDLFDIEHAEMHHQAKLWMKETAQSCSTVAVLIAGVVFAAAYAIPGGTQGGKPVLHNSSAFRVFTIMDVVALACSLGSVVMFLSILTSSFDLWEFHKSLPRKLKLGFLMLFFSLICTMLAFAATILLTIQMEGNKKTTTFTYSLAFVVVSIFGLTQFPLYKLVQDQKRLVKRQVKKFLKY